MGSCKPTVQNWARSDSSASRTAAGPVEPEDVLLAWLLWLPEGEDLAAAAVREIARIDRVNRLAPALLRLRTLLTEIVKADTDSARPGQPAETGISRA